MYIRDTALLFGRLMTLRILFDLQTPQARPPMISLILTKHTWLASCLAFYGLRRYIRVYASYIIIATPLCLLMLRVTITVQCFMQPRFQLLSELLVHSLPVAYMTLHRHTRTEMHNTHLASPTTAALVDLRMQNNSNFSASISPSPRNFPL